jgi:hypothetical protein
LFSAIANSILKQSENIKGFDIFENILYLGWGTIPKRWWYTTSGHPLFYS